MKHYLNACDIDGSKIEPVDIITFGSPCQGLSVAGKRAGIHDDERSNLFFEAIRIIKEMRKATNDEYPKFAVWENVPGSFSSNKGRDFHAVLEALCSVCDDTVSIPEPYDKKRTKLVWSKAGEIVGDNYSVAWRTLDAQYWGVPQRRKRIYLVADFTGRRAGEILFKPDSVRRDTAQGAETGESAPADAVGGVDRSVGISINGDIAGTLDASYYKGCGLRNGVERDVIALQANGIDRADTAGCNGCVAYNGRPPKSITDYTAVAVTDEHLRANYNPSSTPTECARLQGFPDWWGELAPYDPADAEFWEQVRKTHAEITGKTYNPPRISRVVRQPATDSAE